MNPKELIYFPSETEQWLLYEEPLGFGNCVSLYERPVFLADDNYSNVIVGVVIAGRYAGIAVTFSLFEREEERGRQKYIALKPGYLKFPLPAVEIETPLGQGWFNFLKITEGMSPRLLLSLQEIGFDKKGCHPNGWQSRGIFSFKEESFPFPEAEIFRLREGLLFRFQSGRDRLLTGPRPGKVWCAFKEWWECRHYIRQGDLYITLTNKKKIAHSFGWENLQKKEPPFALGRHIVISSSSKEENIFQTNTPVVIPASRDIMLRHPEHDEILLGELLPSNLPEAEESFFYLDFFPGASNPWESTGGD